MTSVCISNCVNDARDPRVPVRATYVNLYKWPESDAEFVKSVTANMRRGSGMHAHVMHRHPRVVDSISCRQMFLRSYTFSREEELVPEKTNKCFGKVKEKKKDKKGKVSSSGNNNNNGSARKKRKKEKKSGGSNKRKCLVIRKMKEISCSALFRIFQGCLSCATSVDVVDRND